MKKRQTTRKTKKSTNKHLKLHKIQERNSIQEEEERTEFGDLESSIQNDGLTAEIN